MIELSGEYSRMQETFRSLGFGLILATLLIYFLMAALFKSYVTPLVILFAVPLGLVGVVTMLYLTDTAINVQSLLGVIFMVGIVVSNTVLLVDFAQNLRVQEGPDARPGDPQGGVDPRPAGRDDGPGGLLRPDPDGAGPGPRQRGQRARWAAPSSAASWPAWSPRSSSSRRSIRWSFATRRSRTIGLACVVFLLVHRGEEPVSFDHVLGQESEPLLDQDGDAAGGPVDAQAGPSLHLVVQVLADLVERIAGSSKLDALGHDGAFAFVGDLEVDVLADAGSCRFFQRQPYSAQPSPPRARRWSDVSYAPSPGAGDESRTHEHIMRSNPLMKSTCLRPFYSGAAACEKKPDS